MDLLRDSAAWLFFHDVDVSPIGLGGLVLFALWLRRHWDRARPLDGEQAPYADHPDYREEWKP